MYTVMLSYRVGSKRGWGTNPNPSSAILPCVLSHAVAAESANKSLGIINRTVVSKDNN